MIANHGILFLSFAHFDVWPSSFILLFRQWMDEKCSTVSFIHSFIHEFAQMARMIAHFHKMWTTTTHIRWMQQQHSNRHTWVCSISSFLLLSLFLCHVPFSDFFFFLCFLPQSKRLNVFCWWLWHVKCFPNVWNKTTGKIPMITVEKHWHTHAHAHTTPSFRISGRRLWMKYAATNRTQFKLIDTSVFSPES